MKVLITGGAGFIGSKLSRALVLNGHNVIILDNLSKQIHGENPSWPDSLVDVNNIDLVLGDVCDFDLVNKQLAKVDAVVHLAAETGTGQSMYQIHHYSRINIESTSSLLESVVLRHKKIKKFVFASSRSVYGEGSYLTTAGLVVTPNPRIKSDLEDAKWDHYDHDGNPLTLIATKENADLRPSSIYAATKFSAEVLARIISENYKLSFDALRFQNVYGEGQSLMNPYTGILSIFSNMMRQNKPINIFEDGNESRDFIHVDDVVTAIMLSLNDVDSGYRVMNIGSGKPTSVIEIANALKAHFESSSDLVITGDYRLGDIRHCYADISHAKLAIGFESRISIKDGLSRFCDWVKTCPIQEIKSSAAQNILRDLGLGKSTLIS